MRTTFSTNAFCEQVPITANGEKIFRLPFHSFKQFNPGWCCRWCCLPTWPVHTADGEHECTVDYDRVSLFVDVTTPHACAHAQAESGRQ